MPRLIILPLNSTFQAQLRWLELIATLFPELVTCQGACVRTYLGSMFTPISGLCRDRHPLVKYATMKGRHSLSMVPEGLCKVQGLKNL